MEIIPFSASTKLTLGVEIELQLIDPRTYDLVGRARDVLRRIRRLLKNSTIEAKFKPEITQSMLEVNSCVHETVNELLQELSIIRDFLVKLTTQLDLKICGGGTHPFQKWSAREIFPEPRYQRLLLRYGYLAKRFTVFGLHIHLGCTSCENALYLTHALARYIPHFIALSASSPFYQGVDTYFDCSRINIVNAFPHSGAMPFLTNWEAFCAYYTKMQRWQAVSSIKDFYWDIRPQPQYGSIEIRVCDTPLSMEKVAMLAAYAQTLVHYLSEQKPFVLTPDLYLPYNYNRFQASRYGLRGNLIEPVKEKQITIVEDILQTVELLAEHACDLKTSQFLHKITEIARNKHNDAYALRQAYSRNKQFSDVVNFAVESWLKNTLQ